MTDEHAARDEAEERAAEAPVEPGEAHGYDIPPPPSPDARKALTAFLVVVEADGSTWATNDVNLDVVLERPPTPGDMYRGCAEIMKDIAMAETSQRTVQLLAAVFPQMAAQAEEQKRQAKVAQRLIEKGIHVPGR